MEVYAQNPTDGNEERERVPLQRDAWIEFHSAYGETYPNMAIVVRVMLVQLTNAANAEQYFSWHKNLLGSQRHSIDVDLTL